MSWEAVAQGAGFGLQALSAFSGGGAGSAPQTFQNSQGAFNAAQAMQMKSLDSQQQMQNQQADEAVVESSEAAKQIAEQAKTARETQALTYDSSGILLEGTPMKVLNRTRELAQQEIAAVQRRGAAQANLFRMQGMIGSNEGRAQLLGAQMNFQAQQAQASMAAAAQKSASWQSLLSGLGGAMTGFGGKSGGSTIANAGTSYTGPSSWTLPPGGIPPEIT